MGLLPVVVIVVGLLTAVVHDVLVRMPDDVPRTNQREGGKASRR
jgi:hypothetical protein